MVKVGSERNVEFISNIIEILNGMTCQFQCILGLVVDILFLNTYISACSIVS